MRNTIKIFVFTTMLFIIACKQDTMRFSKLENFSKIDTLAIDGKTIMFKTDCYLVDNYSENLQTEKKIDSFAYKNRAFDLKKYSNYIITIYKSSDVTNFKNLKQNPKDFEVYSLQNDLIFEYRWSAGQWSGKLKRNHYKDVEAQPMIRED